MLAWGRINDAPDMENLERVNREEIDGTEFEIYYDTKTRLLYYKVSNSMTNQIFWYVAGTN